jgi:methylated-DNA-[protein]-cysteine S-methyltransferase
MPSRTERAGNGDEAGRVAGDLRLLTAGAEDRAARAAERLAEGAERAGLADVLYARTDSPIGTLLVAVSRHGLVRVAFPEETDVEQDLADTVSPRILHSLWATQDVRRELDEYFDGLRHRFDVPVDLSGVHGFTRKVLRATTRIPFGSVLTYTQVAGKAGNRRASRAAGNALHANPIPIVVPCHRVVRTGGGLGGYGGTLPRKVALLKLEGALGEDG